MAKRIAELAVAVAPELLREGHVDGRAGVNGACQSEVRVVHGKVEGHTLGAVAQAMAILGNSSDIITSAPFMHRWQCIRRLPSPAWWRPSSSAAKARL